MPVVLGKETRLEISLDESRDQDIYAVFPPRGSKELARGLRRLRLPAFSGRTQKESAKNLDAARIRFFDELCLRVENVDYMKDGEQVPLTPDVDGWKEMIDDDIKFSFVSYFEGRNVLSRSDAGN